MRTQTAIPPCGKLRWRRERKDMLVFGIVAGILIGVVGMVPGVPASFPKPMKWGISGFGVALLLYSYLKMQWDAKHVQWLTDLADLPGSHEIGDQLDISVRRQTGKELAEGRAEIDADMARSGVSYGDIIYLSANWVLGYTDVVRRDNIRALYLIEEDNALRIRIRDAQGAEHQFGASRNNREWEAAMRQA